MSEELNYSDIVKHMNIVHPDVVDEDASSDGLVEFMLNDTVYTILEAFPELEKDKVVDAVYDVIRKLEGPFHYYLQCVAADGYQAALWDVEEKDESLTRSLEDAVRTSSAEYTG